jgi:hypothetical protein
MNELQKLNYVSYKVILLNTGHFPLSVSISIACAALLVDATPSSLATPMSPLCGAPVTFLFVLQTWF